MNIAVLTGDAHQKDLICQALGSLHACHFFTSEKEIFPRLSDDSSHMLVIDWQMSQINPIKIVHWIREKLPADFPVLAITNRISESDIIAALEAGASDYLVTPIRRGELTSRTQVLLRRTYPQHYADEQIHFGHYIFELRTGKLSFNNSPVELTQKEFELALLLFRNINRPLSRAYILEAIWAQDTEAMSRTVDTHVSRIRNKLRLRPEHGYRLTPVYSYGYRLEQVSA